MDTTDTPPHDAGQSGQPCAEDVNDALFEGDRTVKPGTARAALTYPDFRRVFLGSLGSNVGTWMQNIVLTAYAYVLTGDPQFVAVMGFVQLGPLALAPVGGTLADRFDRRRLMIGVSIFQALTAFGLALVATAENPNRLLLLGIVFLISSGQAVNGPTFSATLPTMVEPRDLSGAVSLTSVNMNLSRVIGGIIGPVIYAAVGVSWVFALNGLTYFFIVGALWTVTVPRVNRDPNEPTGLRRVFEGVVAVRADPIAKRILATVAMFSFGSLIFITQMSTLAAEHLGIDPESAAYGGLWFAFGSGAAVGALSVGSVFVGIRHGRLVRYGLIAFAVMLTVWTLNTSAALAYPIGFMLGIAYFIIITSLSTALQHRIDNRMRGRIMALWIMCFGGTVPIGNLVAGPIIVATSLSAVLLGGAVIALGLAWYARIDDPDRDGEPGPMAGSAEPGSTANAAPTTTAT